MSEEFIKPGVYWNEYIQNVIIDVIANLVKDPYQRASLWASIKPDSMTCQSLPELLQVFARYGYNLDELRIIQALLINPVQFGNSDHSVVLPWLVFDILPRLHESHARLQTLETTIDLLSKKLADSIEDLAGALPCKHRCLAAARAHQSQSKRALQQHKSIQDDGTDTPNSSSRSAKTPECLDIDDTYKVLTERIQVLERMILERGDNMEAHQPFVIVEESAETARNQTMQDAVQEPPSGFAALSKTSTSSTCTLTPASTVLNEFFEENSNVDHVPSVILQLRIAGYYALVHVVEDSLRHPAFSWPLLVRMRSNTPFKVLKDKLRDEDYEKNGKIDLRLKHSPLKCLFDSDTPASLKLTEDVELMYARINGAVETIDLTTP